MTIEACHACGQPVAADQTHCPACGKPQLLRNKYRITGTLSDSALVQMYKALDIPNNRPCVIKLISTTQVALRQIGSDLKALATHARRLPFLPDIYDLWFSDGQLAAVSEYIDGPTLTELTAHGPRAAAEVEELLRTILDYLDILHPIGILHRDIKPDNIKRTPEGRFVLVNFGLSRDETLTGNNAKAYLLPYMAPEQIYGQPASPRSDLYGLGATTYHLLTGQAPPPSIARIVNKKTLIPPDQLVRNIPLNLQIAIMQLLELDPAHRPVNTAAALALLSDNGPPAAPPRSRPQAPPPPPRPATDSGPKPPAVSRTASDGLTIPLPSSAPAPAESASSWTLTAPVQRRRYIPPWVKAAAAGGVLLLIGLIGFQLYTRNATQQSRDSRLTALAVQEMQQPTLTAAAIARQERGTTTVLQQTAVPQQTATAWADQQLTSAAAMRAQAGSATPTAEPPVVLNWLDFKTERYPQNGITLAHDPTWRNYQLAPLPQGLLVGSAGDGSEGIMAVSGIKTGDTVDLAAAVDYVSQFLAKPGTTSQITITGGDTGSMKGTLVMTRLVGGYDVEVKGWVQATAAGNAARVVIAFVPLASYDANQTVLEQAATTVIFP
jgi:serine/threonine protein kinase